MISWGGTVPLTDCTVSGNSATSGGGLANNGAAALTNTIVAGNSGGDISGNSYSGSNDLIGGDPLLAPLGDYGGPTQTMALLPGSPAIGKGTSDGAPAADQPRVQAGRQRRHRRAFQTLPGIVVNTTAGGVGSGLGELSLRQAVNLANALGGTEAITFDPTVFGTPRTITLDGTQLELESGTETITGPGANLLSVSGNKASRVFHVDAHVTASISGLTITDGNGGEYGGGLLNEGTLTLSNCTVSGNYAAVSGGGLDNRGALSLANCTVSGNSASEVGGGGVAIYGTAALIYCAVNGNSTDSEGGGLFSRGGTATLTDCTVNGNGASDGGGLYSDPNTATLTLSNCTVSGNSASDTGGGLFNNGGTATLTDCTVSGNSAQYVGGLFNNGGTATLTNCTVSGNSAGSNGGGINNNGGTATLTNTIVAGNSGHDTGGGSFTGSNNLIGGNPLLAPLGDYGGPTQTMALLPGSPAIGAGTSDGAPAADQHAGSSGAAPSTSRASSRPSPRSSSTPRPAASARAPASSAVARPSTSPPPGPRPRRSPFSSLFNTPQTIALTAGQLRADQQGHDDDQRPGGQAADD